MSSLDGRTPGAVETTTPGTHADTLAGAPVGTGHLPLPVSAAQDGLRLTNAGE